MLRLVFDPIRKVFCGGIFLILFSGGALGADAPLQYLTITSGEMIVKALESVAIFDGHVVMKKGDVTLTADHAEVEFRSENSSEGSSLSALKLFAPGSKSNQVTISIIRATGNVRLQQADKHGEADEAIYYHDDGKVVMTGNPRFSEKDYQVSGTKITVYLHEDRSVVEGSKVRVRAGVDSE